MAVFRSTSSAESWTFSVTCLTSSEDCHDVTLQKLFNPCQERAMYFCISLWVDMRLQESDPWDLS